MKDKRQLFLNIWNKKNSPVRDRIQSKLINRGIEPTELNCYEYWMGYIRYYVNAWTGKGIHCNPRKNKSVMKSLKRSRIDAEQKEKRPAE